MRPYFATFLSTLLFATGIYAAPTASPQPTMTDPAKSIIVSPDHPTFTIQQPANPSTGYAWLLKSYNPQFITVTNYTYTSSGTTMPGAPGTATWQFKVKPEAFTAPQISTISFIYQRPWETQGGNEVTFTIVTSQ